MTRSARKTWTRWLVSMFITVPLLLSSPVHADTRKLDVVADQATFVELFYVYDPSDCSVQRILETDMVQPKGGVLFLKYVPTTIVTGNCKGRKVQAAGIFYRSLPGFRGRDVGRVHFRYSSFDDSLINRRTKSFKVIATVQ